MSLFFKENWLKCHHGSICSSFLSLYRVQRRVGRGSEQTRDSLVHVMPSCDSASRPDVAVAPSVHQVCRFSAVLHFPKQLWEQFLCWHNLSLELKPIQIFTLKSDIFSLCLYPSISLRDLNIFFPSESLLSIKITIALVCLRNQSILPALKK